MPRRRPGTLLPLELDILRAAVALRHEGTAAVHGFGLAQVLRERDDARALTAHGTLYKALGRLEEFELMTSRWEDTDPDDHSPGRPRRRLYSLTAAGALAAAAAAESAESAGTAESAEQQGRTRPGTSGPAWPWLAGGAA